MISVTYNSPMRFTAIMGATASLALASGQAPWPGLTERCCRERVPLAPAGPCARRPPATPAPCSILLACRWCVPTQQRAPTNMEARIHPRRSRVRGRFHLRPESGRRPVLHLSRGLARRDQSERPNGRSFAIVPPWRCAVHWRDRQVPSLLHHEGFTVDAGLTLRPMQFLSLAAVGYNLTNPGGSAAPQAVGGGACLSLIPGLLLLVDSVLERVSRDAANPKRRAAVSTM